jgi:aspartate kinase
MLGAHGFLARVFDVFARHETAVDVVTTSEVSVSLTVDRGERLSDIVRELETVGRVGVVRGTALVCLVGRGMLEHPQLPGAVLATLAGIPLRMFCLGSSDVNLTLVVDETRAEEAVRRLHARFLEEGR